MELGTKLYDYPITINHRGLRRAYVVYVNRSIYSKEQADKAKMLVEEILDVIYRAEGKLKGVEGKP